MKKIAVIISLLLNEGTSLQAKWYGRNCVHNNEGNHHKIEAYFLMKKSRLPWAYPLIKRHRLTGCHCLSLNEEISPTVCHCLFLNKEMSLLLIPKEISPNSYHGLLRNWEVAPGLLRNWEVATVPAMGYFVIEKVATVLAYFLIKKCC